MVPVGLSRPPATPYPLPDVDGAIVARHAEAAGFESVFYGEHPITPVGAPGYSVHTGGVPYFQDLLVMLARASAVTERLTVGAGVFLLPQHNPVRFAKEIACLDLYSGGGRVVLGIGTGWSPLESAAVGGRFERRWAQAEEAIGLIRRLWTEERVEHHGEFWDLPPLHCFPQPASPPPPFLLGSRNDHVFAKIARYADGWLPAFVTRETMETGPALVRAGRRRIAELAEKYGRNPARFQVSVIIRGEEEDGGFRPAGAPDTARRALVEQFAEAGADRVLVSLPTIRNAQEAKDAVERIAARVL